jgi:diguanylate cyclase (GGDEF)-like protein
LAVPVGHGGEFCAVTVLGAGYAALDALTGLGNRHALTRRRETGWGAAGGAALLLDLDGMKEINDLWGHAAGDAVLAHTARVLASSVGSSDLALRWGGDEFAVFLPGAGRQRAMALREEIRRRLERRGELPAEYPLGVSCGIGLWNPGEDPAAAVRRADPELYRKPARKPTHFMGGMKRPPCVFQP